MTEFVAIAAFRTNSLYPEYGVDILEDIDPETQDTTPVEWYPAPEPTIEDRVVDEDGDVLDEGSWKASEADDLLAEHGYRRTGEWEHLDEYAQAPVERV